MPARMDMVLESSWKNETGLDGTFALQGPVVVMVRGRDGVIGCGRVRVWIVRRHFALWLRRWG